MPISSRILNSPPAIQTVAKPTTAGSSTGPTPQDTDSTASSVPISGEDARKLAKKGRAHLRRLSSPAKVMEENIASTAGYARDSLYLWAEKTREKIIEMHGEHLFAHLPHNEEGDLEDRQAIISALSPIAYDLFASIEKAPETRTFTSAEQEQLVSSLETLSQDGKCMVQAQGLDETDPVDGLSPLAALAINEGADAKASHFLVLPNDIKERSTKSNEGSFARLSLGLSLAGGVEDVIKTSRSLVSLLHEFKDIATHFKIIAASEQGTRRENIIMYLNQANYERARELDAAINKVAPSHVWKFHKPWGMQPTPTGNSYAEFSKSAVFSSYGDDRSCMLIDAVIDNLDYGISLKDALHTKYIDRGYSSGNPAFIAGS